MGEKHRLAIPVKGGMLTEGDPALFPEGACEVLKNVEYIGDGLYARQAFPCDYVSTDVPFGFLRWDDRANRVERLMAIVAVAGEGGGGKLLVKSASGGETWSQIGATGNVAAIPVAAYANYRGIVYFTLNDGVTVPTLAYSYDGIALGTATGKAVPGLTARLVAVFGERVFWGNLQLVVTNQLPSAAIYDPTQWTLTSAAAVKETVVVSGRTAVVWRIVPTSATGGKLELSSAFSITSSADPTKLVILVMLGGVDATYRMPMTVELVFRGLPWEASRSYVLGARRHPVTPNGFVYICSQAGTSGGAEPTWPTTIGTEVTDNSGKWKCESTDIIASEKIEVPSTSDSTDPMQTYIDAVIPPVTSTYTLMLRYSFGTTTTPSVSLLPVAFSMDDGQPDGTPIDRKKNFGQQLTTSGYQYPFVAASPGTLQLPDEGVWTEPGQPDVIFAANTVVLLEEPGDLTALAVAGGRLWWFKRRAVWSYTGSEDPDFPILRERVYTGFGAISSRGVDKLDDLLFVIGEHQVYGLDTSTKYAPIQPIELCPEGIRRTIMGHGATWVESISAPSWQKYMAVLRAHPVRKQLWVYTQDRKIFIYDIQGKRWSWFEIPKAGGALARIRDIEWNPTTGRMMVMCDNGIVRQALREETTVVRDTDTTGVAYDSEKRVRLHPFETRPARSVMTVEDVALYAKAVLSQADSTCEVDISFDGGETFTKYNRVRLAPLSVGGKKRYPIPVRKTGESMTIDVTHVGATGNDVFNVLDIDTNVIIRGPEQPKQRPTGVAKSL